MTATTLITLKPQPTRRNHIYARNVSSLESRDHCVTAVGADTTTLYRGDSPGDRLASRIRCKQPVSKQNSNRRLYPSINRQIHLGLVTARLKVKAILTTDDNSEVGKVLSDDNSLHMLFMAMTRSRDQLGDSTCHKHHKRSTWSSPLSAPSIQQISRN